LDESTNALDGQTKQHIVENIISEYKERIVVFVTHDQALAQRVDVAFDLASINKCVPTKLAAPSGVQPDEPTVPLTFIKSLMDE
jgi:ABC-type transport system involved in cytochrome bd biosynthesis fused ATPase/permease subunit